MKRPVYVTFTLGITLILGLFFGKPAMVLAGSTGSATWYNAETPYPESEIQWALKMNIERYYYFHKDRPVAHPEHSVTDIKVLHYIQHDNLISIVGSCRVDLKSQIILGVLGKDRSSGEMSFSGGWFPSNSKNPLLYGIGSSRNGWMAVSGVANNKSIHQLRLISLVDGTFKFVPVSKEGYFASFFETCQKDAIRPSNLLIEGFNSEGKIVYSPPWKFTRIAIQKARQRYPDGAFVRYEHLGRAAITPTRSTDTFQVWLKEDKIEFCVVVRIQFETTTERVIKIDCYEAVDTRHRV